VGTLAWLRSRVNRRKIALALLTGACTWLLAAVALSAADPRAQATALVAALEKKPEAQKLAEASLAKAKDALRRADQKRASGDQKGGAMLEQAALEWASASELETKVFRAQALVEQTVARRARAEEALRKLDQKGEKP
jgi:hypothetical protein